MKLRYVFSAPAMIRLQPTSWGKDDPSKYNLFAEAVNASVDRIRNDVRDAIDGVELDIDILYNSYTEKELGNHIIKNNFGFSKLYADSGGLQIVTRGMSVTPEIKKQIYKTQAGSDFAMCFDEIPTRSVISAESSSRNRTSDKMYFPDEAPACAAHTARNIQEQIEIISSLTDKTKVMYIVQGNTAQDMIEWFQTGSKIVTNYDGIGGLALADTCMGNGVLESAEMLVAYNQIRKEFGPEVVKNQIHLLGVGSVSRLLPVLYSKNGLISDEVEVSFDSTSYSIAYIMGKFAFPDGKAVFDKDERKFLDGVLRYYQDIYERTYAEYDHDKFLQHLLKNIKSVSNTLNNIDGDAIHLAQAHVTATILYQMLSFVSKIKTAMKKIKHSNSPLRLLQNVKDMNDFNEWRGIYGKYLDSARILRYNDIGVLDFD